ncbi:uncharacterized protein LOC112553581 isoform X1 [Pomacea canaliculata]|uniref:uncharacterized protein LOC112553581 isoform X1 n=1 Tax=Pomacea canaliculata TaxID=400727 RepID=UPI000D726007|nr:uncharacterized protein LOC112553581 isoform X1 [Pomacea canaliculata]
MRYFRKSSCTHLSSSIFNKSYTKQDRKREMLGAIAGVPVGPGLVIHFYGKKRFETKPLFIAADSFPICAEDVCKRCAVHLTESLGRFYPQNKNVIGPAWLPIFGLYGANHQQQLWVPEYHIFEPSASPGQESFYFRIKVRFSKDKLKYYFGIISDYLYLQVADDFRNGRLWSHFDAEINDVSSLSRNVVLELISSAGYSVMIPDETKILTAELKQIVKLQNIKSKIKFVCFWKNVPKNMPPKLQEEFRLDPLMRYLMFEHLKRGLGELFELWKTSNLAAMRQQFLEDIFTTYAKNYGLEHYSAKKVLGDRVQEVDVIIRPYAVGCRPGLHFAETHVCSLQDINDIRILENESSARTQSRQVLIYRSNMLPLLLEFDTRQAAESFVSVLETYRGCWLIIMISLAFSKSLFPAWRSSKCCAALGLSEKKKPL